MKKKNITIIILGVLLIIAIVYSLVLTLLVKYKFNDFWHIDFKNANTRNTYETYHHISEAQKYATGKGIKVGILDWCFGYDDNKSLYAGGKDFIGDIRFFNKIGEHGLWMATTLKEIAPDVEIYALCVFSPDHNKRKDATIKAIEWAIENKIDILTCSGEAFRKEDRPQIDKVVLKAIHNNIVTTFIHYDLQENILPYGFFPKADEHYSREYDVNIFHFDYNMLLIANYKNYLKSGKVVEDRGDMPYFSFSSMSPVLAGIVAMIKEENNTLTVSEIKSILIETSKEVKYKDYVVKHVVDANEALKYVIKMNQKK
jgi:hypothetical protein